jgi:hypothetical protein
MDTSATTATSPSFDRARPSAQLTQVVVVFPSENDAIDAIAAFAEPEADKCVETLLGRQKGAAAVTIKRLDVTPWSIANLGAASYAFDLSADLEDTNGEEIFHVAIAVVRVDRAIDFVAIFVAGPPGDDDAAAVSATASKLASTALLGSR